MYKVVNVMALVLGAKYEQRSAGFILGAGTFACNDAMCYTRIFVVAEPLRSETNKASPMGFRVKPFFQMQLSGIDERGSKAANDPTGAPAKPVHK
ncbi:unnamed protein product, partial [Iphiclides podalirius]